MLGNDKSIRSTLTVKEVVGEVNGDHISRLIQEKCGAGHMRVDASSTSHAVAETQLRSFADTWHRTAGSFAISEDTKPRVINLDFPALPSGNGRSQKLIENGTEVITFYYNTRKLTLPDAFLASVLDLLSSNKFTVIYTTTPPNAARQATSAEAESYELDAQFHAPVHMELKRDYSNHKRASDGNITLPDGPLFERYQYLTPGTSPAYLGRVNIRIHIDYSM